MKKLLAIILAVAMCLSLGTAAFAAEDVLLIAPAPAEGVNVNVTISSEGELVLAAAPLYVTDLDEDGALTINDALIKAHDEHYVGEDGYATYTSDYGVSIDTLWGITNGGTYGFYANDISSWSLTDPIAEGDYIAAFSYVDLEAWTDAYTYFDKRTAEAAACESFELTLKYFDWMSNENMPVVGAEIVVDGVKTGVVTDENGKAAIVFDKAGEYVVSAVSDTAVIVPPVCEVNVSVNEAAEATRAFAVELLYGAADDTLVPEDFAADFTDTDSAAFRWAAYNGIIEGYGGGKAGPKDDLTREQLAVILWRYAKKIGADVSVGEKTHVLSYDDSIEISDWAISGMEWAISAGIITDVDGNILPAGAVTCGEITAAVAAVAE